MKFIALILLLLTPSSFASPYDVDVLSSDLIKLSEKLKNQIFQDGDFSLTDDIFSSSSMADVTSFIDTLEGTSDPNTIRAYLNYLSQNDGTSIRYLEALKKKLAQNPQVLRKIQRTLTEIKGEMKRANLRFPMPIRCASGIATYVGMQDWYLSFKSSFYPEEYLQEIYKDQIRDPSYKLLLGFMVTTCLGDAILSYRNSKEYFRELKIDKSVEKGRQLFLDLSNDLANSRVSLAHSKAKIEALVFIDQNISELADQLANSLKLKMEQQKSRLRKGLKGFYYSYMMRLKHKGILQKFYETYNGNVSLKNDDEKLLQQLKEDFATYFSEYKKTTKGESLREIEDLYEKELNELIQSRQPAPLSKACYGGLGVATTLFGLHAAAGRNETNVDEIVTKLVRGYYTEYKHIVITALIAPCVWQLNHLPRLLFKRYLQDSRDYILDQKDMKIVKKALFNHNSSQAKGKPIFTRPVDIVKKAINPQVKPRGLLEIPSRTCLEKIKKRSRIPASARPSQTSSSCVGIFKKILGRREKENFVDYSYETIAQLRSYNDLYNFISEQKKLTDSLHINDKINALAMKYCTD